MQPEVISARVVREGEYAPGVLGRLRYTNDILTQRAQEQEKAVNLLNKVLAQNEEIAVLSKRFIDMKEPVSKSLIDEAQRQENILQEKEIDRLTGELENTKREISDVLNPKIEEQKNAIGELDEKRKKELVVHNREIDELTGELKNLRNTARKALNQQLLDQIKAVKPLKKRKRKTYYGSGKKTGKSVEDFKEIKAIPNDKAIQDPVPPIKKPSEAKDVSKTDLSMKDQKTVIMKNVFQWLKQKL